jgi:spore coat polysaccharide biosynthesis protein SpsF (cytidylyltransferase family)
MPVSITAKGQIDGESLKTLYELFSEANVDVRVDSLEEYMKSRREVK